MANRRLLRWRPAPLRPPTPAGENVKLIPLDHGFHAYVDAADFEWLNQWHWCVYGGGYAARRAGGKVIFMHREIMQPPEGMVVDHISGNGFDNTRANMRNVTPRENTVNQRKRVGAAFIYKGIKCRGSAGKWYAEVRCGDACARAGPFVDEAEAGRAYDRMAVELFGETAGLNFPEEWPPEKRAQVYAEAQPKREALPAQAAAKKRKGKKKSDKG